MHDSSYFMPDGSKRCRFFRDLCQCQKKNGHAASHEVVRPDGSTKFYNQTEDRENNSKLSIFLDTA